MIRTGIDINEKSICEVFITVKIFFYMKHFPKCHFIAIKFIALSGAAIKFLLLEVGTGK